MSMNNGTKQIMTTNKNSKKRKASTMQMVYVVSDAEDEEKSYDMHLNGRKYTEYHNKIKNQIEDKIIKQEMMSMDAVMWCIYANLKAKGLKQDDKIGIIGVEGKGWDTYTDRGCYVKWREIQNKKIWLMIILHMHHFSLLIKNENEWWYFSLFNNIPISKDMAKNNLDECIKYLLKTNKISKRPPKEQTHIIWFPYKTLFENNCGGACSIIASQYMLFINAQNMLNEQSRKIFVDSLQYHLKYPAAQKQHLLDVIDKLKQSPKSRSPFDPSQSHPKCLYQQPPRKKRKISAVEEAESRLLSLKTASDITIYITENEEVLKKSDSLRSKLITAVTKCINKIKNNTWDPSKRATAEKLLNLIGNKVKIFDENERTGIKYLQHVIKPQQKKDHHRSKRRHKKASQCNVNRSNNTKHDGNNQKHKEKHSKKKVNKNNNNNNGDYEEKCDDAISTTTSDSYSCLGCKSKKVIMSQLRSENEVLKNQIQKSLTQQEEGKFIDVIHFLCARIKNVYFH